MSRFLHGKERTPEYEEAVRLMRQWSTEPKRWLDRAYAEAIADSARDRWAEARKVKRSGRHACFKTLLGKRCNGAGCPRLAVNDHDTLWNGPDGKPKILLLQPYGLSVEHIAELHQYCEENGLEAAVCTFPSFHFPGAVLSIEVQRKRPL